MLYRVEVLGRCGHPRTGAGSQRLYSRCGLPFASLDKPVPAPSDALVASPVECDG
nr:hypothetical protein [Moraxella osloensis]